MPTDYKSKSLTENKKPEKNGILSFPDFCALCYQGLRNMTRWYLMRWRRQV